MLRSIRHYSVDISLRVADRLAIKDVLGHLHNKEYPQALQILNNESINATGYNMILKQLIEQKHPGNVKLQIGELSYKASHHSISKVLYSLKYGSDLDVLANLKRFWDEKVDDRLKNKTTLTAYYSVFINSYIMLNQHLIAMDMYFRAYKELSDVETLVERLPTEELFRHCVKKSDVHGLNKFINLVHNTGFMKKTHWHQALSAAVMEADYQLIKTIFDHYLMANIDNSMFVVNEEILFNKDLKVFEDISEENVKKMLQVLSANGDVSRCVGIIEMLYVQRVLTGQKGLSKDMCITVIESYCMGQNENLTTILDVIGGFLKTDSESLTYKDISNFMSTKFIRYDAHDLKKDDDSLEINSGNILANMNVLLKFTNQHIKYIQEKQLPANTITIFLNCLLNHISINQNFSAIVRVLTELEKYNKHFVEEWLNDDLMNIILHCMSNSSSAKLCSLELFNYMRQQSKITTTHYYYFISSILRGDFQSQLKYYLHFYFQDHNKIEPRIQSILRDIPLDTSPEEPVINDTPADTMTSSEYEAIMNKRRYNYDYDVRDAKYIKYLFNK